MMCIILAAQTLRHLYTLPMTCKHLIGRRCWKQGATNRAFYWTILLILALIALPLPLLLALSSYLMYTGILALILAGWTKRLQSGSPAPVLEILIFDLLLLFSSRFGRDML